jgi:hypothetical protein
VKKYARSGFQPFREEAILPRPLYSYPLAFINIRAKVTRIFP